MKGLARQTLHLLPEGVAWVRLADLRRPQLRDVGFAPSIEGAGPALFSAGRVDVVLRGVDVRIERLNLPSATRAEARRVAQRQREHIEHTDAPGSLLVSSLIERDSAGSTIWMVAANREMCRAGDVELDARGLCAQRLVPQSLALGALNRLLPPPATPGLTGILWLEQDSGLCVVADAKGWVFDRQMSLKYARDSLGTGDTPDAVSWMEEEHRYVERVATELERTFFYVQRHLELGDVQRFVVGGSHPDLEVITGALQVNLDLPAESLSELDLGLDRPTPLQAAAALGAATLPRAALAANLLPLDVCAPRLVTRARRGLVAALAVAVVLGALILGQAIWRLHAVGGELERVRAEAARWQPERGRLQRLESERSKANRIHEVNALFERAEPPWTALLMVIGASLPEQLFAKRIHMQPDADGWRIELVIETDGLPEVEATTAVTQFRDRLTALELFQILESAPLAFDRDGGSETALRFRLRGWIAAVRWGGERPSEADLG